MIQYETRSNYDNKISIKNVKDQVAFQTDKHYQLQSSYATKILINLMNSSKGSSVV